MAGADLPFGVVVGRLDVCVVDERPQGLPMLQHVGARAREAVDIRVHRALEHRLQLRAERRHPRDERRARELAVAEVVPVLEDDPRVFEQLTADIAGDPGALGERDELPQQMCPTVLALGATHARSIVVKRFAAIHRPEVEAPWP